MHRLVALAPAPLLALAVVLSPSPSRAATLTYTDSVSPRLTNFTDSVEIPLFDATLGTLTGVTFELEGSVNGSVRFESEDAAPATVTANLQAIVTLARPGGGSLVVTLPTFTAIDALTAFDGDFDFGGTSGRAYSNVSGSDSESLTTTALADLALFTGTGTITLPVFAQGASTATGTGNLTSSFTTRAGASVRVTYEYTAAVPEPSSVALAGLGLAGLGLASARRRRRRPAA